MTTQTVDVATPVAAARPWRLGGKTRKGVLVLHIASAGAWLGIDVVMAFVTFSALLTEDLRTKALCYQVLERFIVWPLLVTGLVCLLTGLLLGLGSKYGLVKFWWVLVKLVLNVVLTALVLISLKPGVEQLGEAGRQIAAGGPDTVPVGDMIFPPIVSPTALMIAMLLSVFKPWGRIRKRKGRQ
jgi:hypothetical protein